MLVIWYFWYSNVICWYTSTLFLHATASASRLISHARRPMPIPTPPRARTTAPSRSTSRPTVPYASRIPDRPSSPCRAGIASAATISFGWAGASSMSPTREIWPGRAAERVAIAVRVVGLVATMLKLRRLQLQLMRRLPLAATKIQLPQPVPARPAHQELRPPRVLVSHVPTPHPETAQVEVGRVAPVAIAGPTRRRRSATTTVISPSKFGTTSWIR